MNKEELLDFAKEVIRITQKHAHATSVTYDNNLINEEISNKIEEFLEIEEKYNTEFIKKVSWSLTQLELSNSGIKYWVYFGPIVVGIETYCNSRGDRFLIARKGSRSINIDVSQWLKKVSRMSFPSLASAFSQKLNSGEMVYNIEAYQEVYYRILNNLI
jgi:hypothetical protein